MKKIRPAYGVKNFVRAAALAGLSLVTGACEGSCEAMAKEIRADLEKKLQAGDSREKIESTLENMGISYTYNEFDNRYSSTVRENCQKFAVVTVYVHLDDKMQMSSIEVFNTYTGL